MHLIFELYDQGNVILVDETLTVVGLLRRRADDDAGVFLAIGGTGDSPSASFVETAAPHAAQCHRPFTLSPPAPNPVDTRRQRSTTWAMCGGGRCWTAKASTRFLPTQRRLASSARSCSTTPTTGANWLRSVCMFWHLCFVLVGCARPFVPIGWLDQATMLAASWDRWSTPACAPRISETHAFSCFATP